MTNTVQRYSDIDLEFIKHPLTNDLVRTTGIDCVKRSIKNLVFLNYYEKPFHPEIGSNIRSLLFEPVGPLIINSLEKDIESLINNYEPRAVVDEIEVISDVERNGFEVSIRFSVVNSPEPVLLTLFLDRIR